MAVTNTLWMGDLEPYMDEHFITLAFSSCGETVNNVKLIISKHTGLPAGYCFVEFPDPEAAQRSMLKLNGKVIPGSNPPKRYKLNHASYGKEHLMMPEYSLFVGDLSEDVDDLTLYQSFKKFSSCRTAKVVLDANGHTKGFGFVRFTEESDQLLALREMNHVIIGRKAIRVSLATPKRAHPTTTGGSTGNGTTTTATTSQYSNYNRNTTAAATAYSGQSSNQSYEQYYQQQYSQYQNYYGWDYSNYYDQSGTYTDPYAQGDYTQTAPAETQAVEQQVQPEDDLEALEDPAEEIDIEKENEIFIQESEEFATVLDESRWHNLDGISSTLDAAA